MTTLPIKLAVFDIDGTLLRGDTVCQTIARAIGKYERMCELEAIAPASKEVVISAREEMAGWYRAAGQERVESALSDLSWAPGIEDGVAELREAGVKIALASVTWSFAVERVAAQFGVEHFVGSELDFSSGKIAHAWGDTKAKFVKELSERHGLPLAQIASVGDTSGDYDMLRLAGKRIFVGKDKPAIDGVIHMPEADIRDVAKVILGHERA